MCDCGKEKIICLDNIVRTKRPTKSCGHLSKENFNQFRNTEPNYISEFNRWHKTDVVGRDIECSLTLEDWIVLISGNCFYCGIEAKTQMHSSQSFFKNGIDRQRNDEGYHLDNCVSCCPMCNFAKRSTPLDIFLAWIERVSDNQLNRNINCAEFKL